MIKRTVQLCAAGIAGLLSMNAEASAQNETTYAMRTPEQASNPSQQLSFTAMRPYDNLYAPVNDPHHGNLATVHAKLGTKCSGCHLPTKVDLAFPTDSPIARQTNDRLGLIVELIDEPLQEQLNLKKKSGLVVTDVTEKSVGNKLGVRSKDLLIQVDGNLLHSSDELKSCLTTEPEKAKKLKLLREGDWLEIAISPESIAELKGTVCADSSTTPTYWIGVAMAELDDTLRSHLKLRDGAGILATQVVEKSPAASAGVKANDVILSIGGIPVNDTASLISAVQGSKGKPLAIKLLRVGKPLNLEIKPELRPKEMARTDKHPEALELFEALAVRPGVVVEPSTPSRSSFTPLLTRENLSVERLRSTLEPLQKQSLDAQRKSLDAQLTKLSTQIEELRKAVDELNEARKEKEKR